MKMDKRLISASFSLLDKEVGVQQKKKTCLSCKYFRLEDIHSGLCRVQKEIKPYPMKLTSDVCALWHNCGQQYYIRTGWIKSKVAAEEEVKKGS
jgi:hypothetical protein